MFFAFLTVLTAGGVLMALSANDSRTDRETRDFAGTLSKWTAHGETGYWVGESIPEKVRVKYQVNRTLSVDQAAEVLSNASPAVVAGDATLVYEAVSLRRRAEQGHSADSPLHLRVGPWGMAVSRGYTESFRFAPPAPLPPKGLIRIAALGDTGDVSPEEYRTGRALTGISREIDGIILLGDNFYWKANRHTRMSDTFHAGFELPFRGCLDAGVPFFAILGNHDQDTAREQTAYPPFRMHGRRYYSVSFGNDLLEAFLLDSESLHHGDPAQIDWLEDALSRSAAVWKIVAIHRPLLTVADDHEGAAGICASLDPLLRAHSVAAVLSGHSHVYARQTAPGGWIQWVAGSGGKIRTDAIGNKDNVTTYASDNVFLLIDASPESLEVNSVSSSGVIIDRVKLGAPGAHARITSGRSNSRKAT